MKHKQIIWDFNGTLLDDVRETLDATNALLALSLIHISEPTRP